MKDEKGMAGASFPKPKQAVLSEFAATFTQDDDSNSGDGGQSIEVRREDAGGGMFFVINTDRWAVDSAEELAALLKRVEKMEKCGKDEG